MAYHIEPEFILANMLKVPNVQVTSGILRRVIRKAQSKIHQPILGDVSESALCFAVELRPNMFKWVGDKVARAENAEKYFSDEYVSLYFDSMADEQIIEATKEAIVETVSDL